MTTLTRKPLPKEPKFAAKTIGQVQASATLGFLKTQLQEVGTPFEYKVVDIINGVSNKTGETITDSFVMLSPADIKQQVASMCQQATDNDITAVFAYELVFNAYETERKAVNSHNMKVARNAKK